MNTGASNELAKYPPHVAVPAQEPAFELAQLRRLFESAGTLEISEEQKRVLFAPPNDEDVEIRPDGLIYLPWVEYAARLREAFGLAWALVPHGMPLLQGNRVFWGFYLVVQGKLSGFAIGEQEYHPTNPTMSWGDACEAAKSNALTRLCKGLGICNELWRPNYIRRWKEENAEPFVGVDKFGRKRTFWRKKGEPTPAEVSEEVSEEASAGEKRNTLRVIVENYKRWLGEERFAEVISAYSCESVDDVLALEASRWSELRGELQRALSEAKRK